MRCVMSLHCKKKLLMNVIFLWLVCKNSILRIFVLEAEITKAHLNDVWTGSGLKKYDFNGLSGQKRHGLFHSANGLRSASLMLCNCLSALERIFLCKCKIQQSFTTTHFAAVSLGGEKHFGNKGVTLWAAKCCSASPCEELWDGTLFPLS